MNPSETAIESAALDVIIDRAAAAARSEQARAVWDELTRMAEGEAPPPPLLGYLPSKKWITYKGPKWNESNGALDDALTFNALRSRLWRRRKQVGGSPA